jgi:hypothetical protein
MKCKIHNDAKYEGLDSLAEDLFKFAHKRFKFTKPVTIVFESNTENLGKLFAPTGHYDPSNNKVVIFVDHRHPKDILRSLAHELVHHRQNCAGNFNGGISTDPGYAQRDQHMREMEGDAYRTGNVMLFRDWEDNYKKGGNLMNENNKLRLEAADNLVDVENIKAHAGSCEELKKHYDDGLQFARRFEKQIMFDLEEKGIEGVRAKFADRLKRGADLAPADGWNRMPLSRARGIGQGGRPYLEKILEFAQNTGCDWAPTAVAEWKQEKHEMAEKAKLEAEPEMDTSSLSGQLEELEEACPDSSEEQKTSDKEWYRSQLHEALLKKFKIIK